LTQVINWSGDSGDGVCIGGGDPKDTNHTPLRTMFTPKKFSKNKSNKKSNKKGGKSINKPELAVDLGIDTSIDASNKGFTLSKGINRKLESGRLDRQIDINETQQLGDLLGRGEQQSMFEDPLTSGSGTMGRLQIRDRIAGARDIEGLAGQQSAEKYLGGAGSADRLDSPGEKEVVWVQQGESDTRFNENGDEVTTTKYVNENDSNHTKTTDTHTRESDGAFVIVNNEKDVDIIDGTPVVEHVHEVKTNRKDGTAKIVKTVNTADAVGLHEYTKTNEIDKDGNWSDDKIEHSESVILMEDPTDDNNARPMTAKDDPMGIIGDRDSLHERLRIINPEIDPMNEGDQSGYGSYINPALIALGTSNGGRSTGAWEEMGGAYIGPNLDAVNDSLGGTSTGDVPLI